MFVSYPNMHASLLEQLRSSFYQLQSTRVCTTVLWILAEYSTDAGDIMEGLDTVLGSLGPLPFSKESTDSALPRSLPVHLCRLAPVADHAAATLTESPRTACASVRLLSHARAMATSEWQWWVR